jgi:glycerol-3-phosphate dehydrogenase
VPELPDLLAEAPFAVAHEQAYSLADVLMRRTRLALLAAPILTAEDSDVPRMVAEAMAPELGWDDARIEEELLDWRDLAKADGIALR